MFYSLWPHGLQHARPPCPSLSLVFAQTHVHWVSDAIQPSHSLSSPSPLALRLSQQQGLFQWVSSLHQVTKVLEVQWVSSLHQVTKVLEVQWVSSLHQVTKVLEVQLQASVLPMNIQGWFSLGDWFDFLAVHRTLKSLLQHHSLKASVLWC